ncbi:hypothetical protein DFH09DRAFT_1474705 [Mycena vulgaris]|nr:hypothetical protein DFH09DRAFT_1474705 [Mycena vulgaris]
MLNKEPECFTKSLAVLSPIVILVAFTLFGPIEGATFLGYLCPLTLLTCEFPGFTLSSGGYISDAEGLSAKWGDQWKPVLFWREAVGAEFRRTIDKRRGGVGERKKKNAGKVKPDFSNAWEEGGTARIAIRTFLRDTYAFESEFGAMKKLYTFLCWSEA